jgi:hypothetical protein
MQGYMYFNRYNDKLGVRIVVGVVSSCVVKLPDISLTQAALML